MKRLAIVGAVVVLAVVVVWLRDPAWLQRIESGLGPWQADADGTRFRWTGGRASFFVEAALREVQLPVRVPEQPPQWPTVLTVAIDGRTATRIEIADGAWRTVTVRLPRPGRASRRLRRIDLHVDRTRPGNRGIQLGEIQLIR